MKATSQIRVKKIKTESFSSSVKKVDSTRSPNLRKTSNPSVEKKKSQLKLDLPNITSVEAPLTTREKEKNLFRLYNSIDYEVEETSPTNQLINIRSIIHDKIKKKMNKPKIELRVFKETFNNPLASAYHLEKGKQIHSKLERLINTERTVQFERLREEVND